MNERGRGAARLLAVAVSLPILAVSLFSCSSAPAPSAGALEGAASGAASGAGGTTLKTAEPSALSRSQDERRAIESAIVEGSPSSLARSFALIGEARALKLEDARLLAWIGARLAALVYPEGADAFVPADLRGQAEIPSSPLARSLADAAAGRSPAPSPELEGNPLAELIPALVAFRSESRESARRAAEALDRFERLGSPSVLPALIRGLDAERLQERGRALVQYDLAVVAAPDCWPAAVGAARILLALRRPEEALARLDAAEKAAGPAVAAYATFRKARAETLYESGRLTEAEPLVLGILREDPLDSRFVLARAHLLVRAKAYQQAIPLLDAYATVDPASRRLLVLRALAAEGLRNRDEALKWARKGLAAYPDDVELLAVAARLLFSVPGSLREDLRAAARDEGRELALKAYAAPPPAPAAAAASLDAALAAAAGAEAARLLLVDAAARYDWTSARGYLSRAGAAPGFEDRALAALVLRKGGDWPAALAQAEAWYRERPESEAAAEAYARALVGAKSEKAAQELLSRLLAAKGSPAFRSILFYLQSLLQKSDEAALPALRSALVENADNGEALAAMCDIHYRRKDYQKARFYLKQALSLAPGDPELTRRQRELDAASP